MAKLYRKKLRLLRRELRKAGHPHPKVEAHRALFGEPEYPKQLAALETRLAVSKSKRRARARRKEYQRTGQPWKAYELCSKALKTPKSSPETVATTAP